MNLSGVFIKFVPDPNPINTILIESKDKKYFYYTYFQKHIYGIHPKILILIEDAQPHLFSWHFNWLQILVKPHHLCEQF